MIRVNCDCPVCGSKNTKSLPVIYESGQRFGRSTRNSLWASLSGSVWAGRSATRSHSSNLLSDNAAPPSQFSWSVVGWTTILAVFLFKWPVWVIPVVVLSVAFLYGASSISFTGSLEQHWRETFRCLRCGATFSPFEKVDTSKNRILG